MSHPLTAFKILTTAQWTTWKQSSVFKGAGIDIQDGYIHLSTADQAGETYNKYFAGQEDLVLVEVDLGKVQDPVKWEVSRGGALFPHVYGVIDFGAVKRTWDAGEVGVELFNRLREEDTR